KRPSPQSRGQLDDRARVSEKWMNVNIHRKRGSGKPRYPWTAKWKRHRSISLSGTPHSVPAVTESNRTRSESSPRGRIRFTAHILVEWETTLDLRCGRCTAYSSR